MILIIFLIYLAVLAAPILFAIAAFRIKSLWKKILLIAGCLLLLWLGRFLLGPQRMGCLYGSVSLQKNESPVFDAMEMPYKGWSYLNVLNEFEKYKNITADNQISLCRKCKREWHYWINYFIWNDLLTHARWKLPVCAEAQ